MKRTRRIGRAWMRGIILAQIVGLLVLALAGTALAQDSQASERASCLGHEASAISPPGTSEEIATGMPGLKAFLNEAFPGVPLGKIYSQFAKLHAGSHEACDEAVEG